MALFGNLFEKKNCAICGKELGIFGKTKISEGYLCKDCSGKLSPYFHGHRSATVEDIRDQLSYREANRADVAAFHVTRALGNGTKVYLDEQAGKFFVTRSRNWRDENPDVIDLSQVIDVRTEVTEHRSEEYHNDREGRRVSFNPPRYRFEYEFDTTILVDSPYFNEIRFELTEQRPERQHDQAYQYYEQQADALRAALMPATQPAPKAVNMADALSATIARAVANMQQQKKSEAAPVDDGKWFCPSCGSANEGNFCTNCGTKKPEKPKTFRCDKCGWIPEDPANPPRFCPNCGDPFTDADRK